MAEVVGVFCFFLAIVAVPMVSDAGFRDKMYRRLTCRPPRTAAARNEAALGVELHSVPEEDSRLQQERAEILRILSQELDKVTIKLLPSHFCGRKPHVLGTTAACSVSIGDSTPPPPVLETGIDVEQASQPENLPTPTSHPGVCPLSCRSSIPSEESDTLFLSLPFPDQLAPTSESSAQARSVPNGCQICLSPFVVGQSLSWSLNPACCHVFHRSCMQAWLLTTSVDGSGNRGDATCPCCRLPFL